MTTSLCEAVQPGTCRRGQGGKLTRQSSGSSAGLCAPTHFPVTWKYTFILAMLEEAVV